MTVYEEISTILEHVASLEKLIAGLKINDVENMQIAFNSKSKEESNRGVRFPFDKDYAYPDLFSEAFLTGIEQNEILEGMRKCFIPIFESKLVSVKAKLQTLIKKKGYCE